jgi:acetoin utilization deacetylase AcuC-like enzyme
VRAAQAVLQPGTPLAYALCRPPGHHANADRGGGYCYLNNAAVAVRVCKRCANPWHGLTL